MFYKPISSLTVDDIRQLVVGGISESRTIEYKDGVPGGADSDLKEFLADVSSFSNTSGGDLVLGLRAVEGMPQEVTGIANLGESDVLRLENVIRDGIDPRIQLEARVIPITEERSVLLLRMKKSWLAPHRVIFRGHDKFYARHSKGKYPLDTSELRSAFLATERVSVQVSNFARRRIAELAANETPVPFIVGPKVVLHLIPLQAFDPGAQYPVIARRRELREAGPIYSAGWNDLINLEGVLVYGADAQRVCYTYTQFYRSGIIEAVVGSLITDDGDRDKTIPSITFERKLLDGVTSYLRILVGLGVSPPVNIRLTLLGVKGFRMGVDPRYMSFGVRSIDRDELLLPDGIIEDLTEDSPVIMRPLFDLVWNACGHPRSIYFDDSGKWVGEK